MFHQAMIRSAYWSVALALAVLVWSASTAVAALRVSRGPHGVRLVGEQRGRGFATDGRRYAAWNESADTLRVLDTKTGRSFGIESSCFIVAGAAGHFLLTCLGADQQSETQALLDAKRRSIAPVPGAHSSSGTFAEMGRYWLSQYSYPHVLYLNWRTGEQVDIELQSQQSDEPHRDMDSPGLTTLAGFPFQSWALFGQSNGLSAVRRYNDPGARSFAGPLQLVARHTRRVVSAAPCFNDCGAVSRFAGGRIDWIEPTARTLRMRSYSIHTRRYSTWTVRGIPDPGRPLSRVVPGHTTKRVVFAVLARLKADPNSPGNETADKYTIYSARP